MWRSSTIGRPQSLAGRVTVVDRAGNVTTLSDDYVNIHGLVWKGDEIWYTAADDALLFRAFRAVTLERCQTHGHARTRRT